MAKLGSGATTRGPPPSFRGPSTVVGTSDLAMRGFTAAVKRTAKSPQQQMIAEWLKNYTAPGKPGNAFFKNIRHLHPNVRKRFVAGMMANFFMRDPELHAALLKERGISSPTAILISPSMRCNLRCVGCYAAEYDSEDDLTEEDGREHHQPGRRDRFSGVHRCWVASRSCGGPPRRRSSAIHSRCSWCSPTPR